MVHGRREDQTTQLTRFKFLPCFQAAILVNLPRAEPPQCSCGPFVSHETSDVTSVSDIYNVHKHPLTSNACRLKVPHTLISGIHLDIPTFLLKGYKHKDRSRASIMRETLWAMPIPPARGHIGNTYHGYIRALDQNTILYALPSSVGVLPSFTRPWTSQV